MKFYTKLILILITLLLSCSSSLAWSEGFEGSSSELSSNYYSGNLQAFEHGSAMYAAQGSAVTVDITAGYTGYLAFSVYGTSNSNDLNSNIRFAYANGTYFFNQAGSNMVTVPTSPAGWHRLEFIQNSNGLTIDCYCDGIYKSSTAYNSALNPNVAIIKCVSSSGIGVKYIDDISTEPSMIFSDDTVQKGVGAGQYYRVGCEFGALSGNANWITKTTSPTGRTYETTILNYSEQLIPMSFINESGQYSIKLYQTDDTGGYFPVSTHFFTYALPDSTQLVIPKTDYTPGETLSIYTFVKNYNGYTVEIPYYDSKGALQTYTYALSSQEQTTNFVIPPTARGGSFVIALLDSYHGVKAGKQYNVLASGGLTSLTIDKAVYAPLDVVKISYANFPANSQITIKIQNGGTQTSTNTWSAVQGSGVLTYTIPSTTADNFIVTAISGTTALGQTTGTIQAGTYYLSGNIVDPSDGSLISGASITIGSASTVSDTNGHFNFSVPAGWQSLSITKTGYQSNINKVNIVYKVATQDFYLVKSYSNAGHSLYGIVTDYYTGAPVSSALITLKQGALTHTLFSYTGSGYYIYDAADMAGNWTITVSKAGYYTYSGSVSVAGDLYKQIILTPTSYSSTGDTGSTDGSGSSGSSGSTGGITDGSGALGGSSTDASVIDSTGISQDRPGREAAKEGMSTLETAIPGIIGVVVFRVLFELLKF